MPQRGRRCWWTIRRGFTDSSLGFFHFPVNAAKQECRSLTRADFQQTPLTVHGLWPNRSRVSVNRQPHDCEGPPLGALPAQLQADLRRYMPSGPGLERHEWRKHGLCSGLSSEDYFATVVRLARDANETIGAVMRAKGMFGHSVRIDDLLDAAGAQDRALSRQSWSIASSRAAAATL